MLSQSRNGLRQMLQNGADRYLTVFLKLDWSQSRKGITGLFTWYHNIVTLQDKW